MAKSRSDPRPVLLHVFSQATARVPPRSATKSIRMPDPASLGWRPWEDFSASRSSRFGEKWMLSERSFSSDSTCGWDGRSWAQSGPVFSEQRVYFSLEASTPCSFKTDCTHFSPSLSFASSALRNS